jgi:hypothetical protein
MTYFAACRADGSVCAEGECVEESYVRQMPTDPNGFIARIDKATFEAIKLDREGFYLAAGAIRPREAMPVVISKTLLTADGADEAVITGIPEGATIALSGQQSLAALPVGGDTCTITLTSRGKLEVELLRPPRFKPWRVTIDAS